MIYNALQTAIPVLNIKIKFAAQRDGSQETKFLVAVNKIANIITGIMTCI